MDWAAAIQAAWQVPQHTPSDWVQIILRWLHLFFGILWVGLLYFFNLVNVPFMKEIDTATKGKVVPTLLPRALWYFRWSAVITVVLGFWYWMVYILAVDARNARALGETPNSMFAMLSWFGIWIGVWVVIYLAYMMMGKNGWVVAVLAAVAVAAGSWLYVSLNNSGWQSSRLLAIAVGGGMGLVMLLNVWGVIWRAQKRIIGWTRANAQDGTAIPPQSQRLARLAFLASRTNFWLSFPMLFFMAASSHFLLFGAGGR